MSALCNVDKNTGMSDKLEFISRNYQVQLMKIAINNNTIIFLPTGSGKTYIALLVLKRLSHSLEKKYSCVDGNISIILVNTLALVDQHAKYIRDHTVLTVGCFTGEMNLDFWSYSKWQGEFDKYQVLIMTSQVLVNIASNNFIDLNKVNVLVFDECHHGVSDQPMRQLMKQFQNLKKPPRVLGLTATLLNGNCKPGRVMMEVCKLETTYHSKIATTDGIEDVIGYSTNPKELVVQFENHSSTATELKGIELLRNALEIVAKVPIKQNKPPPTLDLQLLDPPNELKLISNLIEDLVIHIGVFGLFGGFKACLATAIRLQRLRKHTETPEIHSVLSFVLTIVLLVKDLYNQTISKVSNEDQVRQFSSDKVRQLINILRRFKFESNEELCALIFTERRTTSKIIHHVLAHLSEFDPDFKTILTNFMVGANNNPYIDTREPLFLGKKNRQVLENFVKKEINVLIATNVLEEGVDIPKCSLVVKFDRPKDYRSYVQSKGRARHKRSLYYMMVEKEELGKFHSRYAEFREVENILNDHLIGKNQERSCPNQDDIEEMYNEDLVPPYYVNGPDSAYVRMATAVASLCQYCDALPSDMYTQYAPEWFCEEKQMSGLPTKSIRVIVQLPIVCPLREPIVGAWMLNRKNAKRAAALETCKLLHQCGEFDDNFVPKRSDVCLEDSSFLFEHYPSKSEDDYDTSKARLHPIMVPEALNGQIEAGKSLYLHIIQVQPEFEKQELDAHHIVMFEAYSNNLCFGFLTVNELSELCSFPIYVTMGTLNISVKVNAKRITLSEDELRDVQGFHYLIFNDVLNVMNAFLSYNKQPYGVEMLLLVPIHKDVGDIDFEEIKKHKQKKPTYLEPTHEERVNVDTTVEHYQRKIVSPWYRTETFYIVSEVCQNKSPRSLFPNPDYGTYMDYYREKHKITIANQDQPLLLVKGLTKRLNFMRPRVIDTKRKRDILYQEMNEYLIPELLIKQEFPSCLWVQASFLPTILSRVSYLLRLEQLRVRIVQETGMGTIPGDYSPLELDENILNRRKTTSAPTNTNTAEPSEPIPSAKKIDNSEFAAKVLEREYPWKDLEEPKDLERELNVTDMDIEYYEFFINNKVNDTERELKNTAAANRTVLRALTYHSEFEPKSIACLRRVFNHQGPKLAELYRACTTAKANDIVNLERHETLGDSFLKYMGTLYISTRFPKYNEGQLTTLKGRLVSNKSLFYLGRKLGLPGIIKYNDLLPKEQYLPPSYSIPKVVVDKIVNKQQSINMLFNINIEPMEQITGDLSKDTLEDLERLTYEIDENEESSYASMSQLMHYQYIRNKQVADVVEALIGTYFECGGVEGAAKMMEWLGIVPQSENLLELLKQSPPNPLVDPCNFPLTQALLNLHVPHKSILERQLGYTFKNPAYLLQAITHSSYTPNRLTLSYENLEFLGDAILDFLITCYIYEHCGNLTPGELTDLRSALVNNNTFASYVVRLGLHKFLLIINPKLEQKICKFADYMEQKNYVIDEAVLILLEEQDINMAECVNVPKTLGDFFESLFGAIYYDCGRDLEVVWNVAMKIMWKELDMFARNVPINPVRKIHEWPNANAKFSQSRQVDEHICTVSLEYMVKGVTHCVHGFGSNRRNATRAAAKIALNSLEI